MKEELLQIKQRILKLREQIDEYRYAYHVLDKNLINEGALDSLKNELFKLEQKYGYCHSRCRLDRSDLWLNV